MLNINPYIPIFSMENKELFGYLYYFLSKHYNERNIMYYKDPYDKLGDFLYVPGKQNVMLTAHVDTVFEKKPKQIVFKEKDVLTALDFGLGADDRAGIIAIIEIVKSGFRPTVLITNGEERFGVGAQNAVEIIYPMNIIFIIEIDRRGVLEAVFYECSNRTFKEYILSFGFFESFGTFTDISIFCPAWNIAGVNLSAGYYNAHTINEYFNVRHLSITIEKIKDILSSRVKRPFKYVKGRFGRRSVQECLF